MTGISFNSRGSVGRALVLHAATVVVAAGGGLAVALAGPEASWPVLAAAALLVLALLVVVSGWRLHRLLRPAEIVERLLAHVETDGEHAFDLPDLGIASPAAAGWKRLKLLAQRWATVYQIEQTVAAGLSRDVARADANLIDALADGVAASDDSGRIVQANAAFAAICQVADRDQMAGKPCLECLGVGEEAAATLASAPPGKRTSVEYPVAAGEGMRTLRLTRSPRFDAQQDLIGHVWVVRDVTQRRLAEDMRDKFLATATHELRTPLANIRAYAEALSIDEDVDPETQKQFYNVIQSEAVRLSQLIDDLLDVSRMQAGALAIDRRTTDLSRLVEEVAAKVEGAMKSKEIDFQCEFPPKFPKVLVDKSKIAAALVNLLGNAAKYTPDGGRVAFRVDANERQLEFSVADTGIGISPESLPHVFERFYRCDDERVRDIPGSGLGLSLTQEIARLHGGDLNVESELNVGSIFRLTLPIDSVD